ncbi:50S ribosome-binding GTPase [Candidatus Pacearchaeota archaeon]|nr:50S ribosome-binding GTPase [Candidatus Pacearchaeota archaeon]
MAGRKAYAMRKQGRPSETHNKHRKEYPALAKEVIRISDVVLQVLDARFLQETRNLELEGLIKREGKFIINIINKVDLVDINSLKKNPIMKQLVPYVLFSCNKRIGLGKLRERIKIEVKRFGVTHAKAHVGVIGYPNTGKSSLINFIAGRSVAGTSSQSGFSRGIQKIRFSKDILILDTPGVIPSNEHAVTSSEDMQKHAEINVRTFDSVKNPDLIVGNIMQKNPGLLEKFYDTESEGDPEIFLEKLGRKRNILRKGGKIDIDRSARIVLKDWQEGKIIKL